MPFGIPNSETGVNESRARVKTRIMTIQELRSGVGANLLVERGGIFGKTILNDLPDSVKSFTYSNELPTVTAARDTGVESWNATRAFEWAIETETEGVKNGLRESVGKIL